MENGTVSRDIVSKSIGKEHVVILKSSEGIILFLIFIVVEEGRWIIGYVKFTAVLKDHGVSFCRTVVENLSVVAVLCNDISQFLDFFVVRSTGSKSFDSFF